MDKIQDASLVSTFTRNYPCSTHVAYTSKGDYPSIYRFYCRHSLTSTVVYSNLSFAVKLYFSSLLSFFRISNPIYLFLFKSEYTHNAVQGMHASACIALSSSSRASAICREMSNRPILFFLSFSLLLCVR